MTYGALKAKMKPQRKTNISRKNEMKVLREIVGKTNVDRIRNQQIKITSGIRQFTEWMDRRRNE